jgi:hypothetical protein
MKTAAVAAVAALAAAAPAQAASQYSLHAGPLNVRGYAMTVDASHDSVDVTFTRAAPGTRQTHAYTFEHVRLTAPTNLRGGRLKGDLGRFGSIDLRFRRTGAIHKRGPGPHCDGPADRHRAGRLTGTFRLVVDTTFFGTVTAHRLNADLTRFGGSVCATAGAAPEFPGPLTLVSGGDTETSLTIVRRRGGSSSQDLTVSTAIPDAVHEIESTGPAGSFTGSTTAATVHAAPGFSGTLAYAATKRHSRFATDGALSGDYTALFDSLGPVTFTGPASVTGPS